VYIVSTHTDVAFFTELYMLQGWDTSILLIFNNCPLKYKQVLYTGSCNIYSMLAILQKCLTLGRWQHCDL